MRSARPSRTSPARRLPTASSCSSARRAPTPSPWTPPRSRPCTAHASSKPATCRPAAPRGPAPSARRGPTSSRSPRTTATPTRAGPKPCSTPNDEPHAAVAPAIRNADPETAVSWADLHLGYGRWLAPGRRGTMNLLPGHNVSYKRSVLLEYDDLDVLMEAETVLLRDLRRRGHTLLFEPAATTAHTNFSRFRVLLDVQWHVGRVFAATRAARWSTPRRLAYAAASPAIPLIRLSHVLRYGRRNRVPAATIARAAPALAAALAVDCAAQAAGALLGGGRSVARLAACEFHRAEVNRTGRPPADKAAPPAGGGTVPASRSSG